MEQAGRMIETPVFSSTEEELKYLRERVAEKEKELAREPEPAKPEAAIAQTIIEYAKDPNIKVEEHLILEDPNYEKALERMSSQSHREKMRELYRVLAEKGVLASIKMVQALQSPHLEDDFHGVLIDYIKTGVVVPGLEKERELSKLLHMTLYEVTLPFLGMQEGEKATIFKEVISEMERFYLGMLPLDGAPLANYGHFSLELVLSNFSNDIVFYIAVEEQMKDLFVKQILGAFPTAKVEEHKGDYNIFNEQGASVGSFAAFSDNFVFPINDAEGSEQDPFTTILNSFTKIERNGEGAAIQLIVYPDPDKIANKVKHALGQIRQGIPVARATDIPLSTGGAIAKTFTEFFHTQVKGEKKDPSKEQREADAATKATTLIEEKIANPLLRANLRIVVSAATKERAEAIRMSMEAAFNQFTRPQSNGIKWNHAEKAKLAELLRKFTYREVNEDEVLIFNTKELATIYHLPVHITQKDAPQLKTVQASSAPPPADLPTEGSIIGVSKYRGDTKEIRLTKADRLRHLYLIGQTGTGKSVFLKNLAVNDILAGNGVCFIDPHGSDVQDVLACVPKERIEDVIYFDPSYTDRPFGLNMLEYDVTKPEQKIFVVNEMLSIFRKLYEAIPESMGPAFEQYFRGATMLVLEDPESGCTLLEIPRVMVDANFRNLKLSRCKNPLVVQFWRDIATKTSGEAGLANMVPYITNKFDVFLQNDIMRPIIAQEKSSFNFREIMDQKKILLVNLSKGRLGDINANLLGLVLVGKFLMAALSRVDSYGKTLPDFYLYIDEFQNITTDSISSILSEARKYGLSLNVAHQFIAQLDEDIKKSVFGNVGNMITFRVGAEDAEFLESQFAPIFKASDIMKIENRNAYAKILINGKPVPPFNIETLPPPMGHPEIVEQLKQLSYLKYGRDRRSVDEAIMKKYTAAQPTPQPAPQTSRPIQPTAPQNQFTQAFARTPITPSIGVQAQPQPQAPLQSGAATTPPPRVSTPATAQPQLVVERAPAQAPQAFTPPSTPMPQTAPQFAQQVLAQTPPSATPPQQTMVVPPSETIQSQPFQPASHVVFEPTPSVALPIAEVKVVPPVMPVAPATQVFQPSAPQAPVPSAVIQAPVSAMEISVPPQQLSPGETLVSTPPMTKLPDPAPVSFDSQRPTIVEARIPEIAHSPQAPVIPPSLPLENLALVSSPASVITPPTPTVPRADPYREPID